jgi:hypothetical protein
MGDIMFLGGHSNRGGDGVTSKVSHFWILYINRDPLTS